MPLNLTQQILHSHLVSGYVVAGANITVGVDQVLVEDATGTSEPRSCAVRMDALPAKIIRTDERRNI